MCDQRCYIKKAVLKNFAICKGKHLSWSLFLTDLQAWRSLLKRDSNSFFFPLNIAKFLKTPILKNFCERVFLRLYRPSSCLFLYPMETSENESFRYFQWVYKETVQNGLIRHYIKAKQYLCAFLIRFIRLQYPKKRTLKI